MEDRIPTPGQEGRVLITPEDGSAPYYAIVEMADNPTNPGTPLNKDTLLKDDTASLFGLENTALLDDVFALLANFKNNFANEYVWAKETHEYSASFSSSEAYLVNTSIGSEITYYNNYEPSKDGILLKNPVSITLSDSNYTQLIGKYVYQDASGSPGIVDSQIRAGSGIGYTGRLIYLQDTLESVEYVNSPDINAYPPEIDDGYIYSGPKILGSFTYVETGSYVGTGTSGESNPTQITFSKQPIFVMISGLPMQNTAGPFIAGVTGVGFTIKGTAAYRTNVTWGKTFSFYSTNSGETADYQMNTSGQTYNYFGIIN